MGSRACVCKLAFCLGLVWAMSIGAVTLNTSAVGVGAYRVRGQFALAIERNGRRAISGHFDELRGSLTVPSVGTGSYGTGRLVMPLAAWSGRAADQEHPLVALTGSIPMGYGVLKISVLKGIDEALRKPGFPVRGTLLGYVSLGGREERVDVTVHLTAERTGRIVVQAINPVCLSRQGLGLLPMHRSPSGGGGYDELLKAFFRFELTASEG